MLIITLCASTIFSLQSTERLARDEFAKQIDAANVLSSHDFETVFEMRVYPRRPQDDQSPWDPLQWETLEEFRFVALGRKLYLHRTAYTKAEDPSQAPIPSYVQENRWVDGTWSHRVNDQSIVSLFAQPGPTDLFSKGFLFNLMDGKYPSYETLTELVANGHTLGQLSEGDILSYRFAQSKTLASSTQHIIHASLKPHFEMTGYTVELADSNANGNFAERVQTRASYQVLEWEEIGNLRLPKRARLDTLAPANVEKMEGPPWIWRAEYTRKSFQEITADDIKPDLFAVSQPVGTKVYDDRIKLSFEIGDTYLSLDGTLYMLKEPVMEHPGERLAEMIQSATPQRPPSGSSSSTSFGATAVGESTRSSLLGSPIFVACLVGVGVALLTIAVMRTRRAFRKVT